MTGRRPPPWACVLLLSLASAMASATEAGLPAWEVLEFEQRGFGVTARSRLELREESADGHTLALTAASSIANNTEPGQGPALQGLAL
jgi:hypothetical protein